MVENDRIELIETTSSRGNYMSLIGCPSSPHRRRSCIIVMGILLAIFILGFVVVLAVSVQSEKQEIQALQTATAEKAKLTEKIQQLDGKVNEHENFTNTDLRTQLQEELAEARAKVEEIQVKIASIRLPSCSPLSCDGVTLKEIEVPSGHGSAIKRNVSMDGNWTVIQRRIDGCLSFKKTWVAYRAGFGSPCGNYWIGLEAIHQLTKDDDHELRIDMIENGTGTHYWVEYNSFKISDSSKKYTLKLKGYSGNATDALIGDNTYHASDEKQFSTIDADNDEVPNLNCAAQSGGGWWQGGCSHGRLNGRYNGKGYEGIAWRNANTGIVMNMKFVEMKIRKRN